MGKGLNRQHSKEEIKMFDQDMQKFSKTLVTGEIQIKITVRQ